MLGMTGAGKTGLVRRFSGGEFDAEAAPTIGLDFASKNIETFDGARLKVQVWDTGVCPVGFAV